MPCAHAMLLLLLLHAGAWWHAGGGVGEVVVVEACPLSPVESSSHPPHLPNATSCQSCGVQHTKQSTMKVHDIPHISSHAEEETSVPTVCLELLLFATDMSFGM